MRLSAMGDVAMIVPVLREFHRNYPDVRITMMSNPFLWPLFDGIPNVRFFPFDKVKYKGVFGLLRLYRDLKQTGVDAFADLHDVMRSNIVRSFFRIGGIPTAQIDKGRNEKKALTRPKNKIFKPLKTSPERYADAFRALGFPMELSHNRFPEKPALPPGVLSVTGLKSGVWIGIAPFAQHNGKVYPEDLMKEVIDALSKGSGNRIFLFGGGKDEKLRLDALANARENSINVAGRFSFADELKLIAHLDLMLSMDSGNGHLAAIAGVPVVTLWGATHPHAGFAPFGQPESNALLPDLERYPKLPTSVFGNKVVEGYEDAMRTIAPETVLNKVHDVLSRSHRR